MYKRLSREEMRIIEETKREGARLEEEGRAAGEPTRKGRKAWAVVIFILAFFLMAFGARLIIAAIG